MLRKTLLTLTLLSLLAPLCAIAGVIKGSVIDAKTKENLEFVNVSLTRKSDGKFVKGTVTDLSGRYQIENVKKGSYTLTFTFIGYTTATREVTLTAAKPNISLRAVAIEEDSKTLKEVQIVGQQSQMKFEIDKKVFNIDQTIANTGGSASDALQNIPSVEVDNEGTVSLRGSESVTVWINGKASGLTSDNQGSILQQMPAESIERVEVITNPSAKFSPEGTAGIINIVLKRNRKAGYYGSVQAGANSQGGYNASGNINYNSGTLDANASISYRSHKFKNGGDSHAQYFGASDTTYQQQHSSGETTGQNLFASAGLTWHATEKDDAYLNVRGMLGSRDSESSVTTLSGLTSGATLYQRLRQSDGESDNRMFNIEVGYTHRFATDHYIDFTASHNQWKANNSDNYRQSTRYSSHTLASEQYQESDIKNKQTELQIDYEYKVNDNTKLQAGYKSSFSRENSPVATYSDRAHTQVQQSLWNRFIYNQDTHALYATYTGRIGNFGYQAGLRGEYWETQTKSLAYGQESGDVKYEKNDFLKLFPSLFFSYSFPHDHELQVNYTRRLRRPWGGQLNSFKNITDSTEISFGNPGLTPEYSNAYELNYIKNWEKHTLSLSSYYRTTDDVIERIRYSEGDIIYSTSENVAKSQSAGVEIVAKNNIMRRLDLTTTVNLFYYKLDAFNYEVNGQTVSGDKDEDFSWNARMMASLLLPGQYTLQLTGRYDARRIVAQGYRKAIYSLDAGVRKSFFDGKLSLALSGRDLLDSRRFHTVTSGTGFTQDSERWHGGRQVQITATYSFGNMRAKKSNRHNNSEGGSGIDSYNGGDMME